MKFDLIKKDGHVQLVDEDGKYIHYLEKTELESLVFEGGIILQTWDEHIGEHGADDWMTEKENDY